jgi:hypothetical protein
MFAPSASPAPPSGWLDLLTAARTGSADALGRLLEPFRRYRLAAAELDPDLRAQAGASDLMPESPDEGQRDFASFRGQRPEKLRQIRRHNLADLR